ncbi:MAG: hypothetical protein JOY84_09715 [Curvibacter sp.]|nr:hypothetical protein [Curvibacter sp.]
MNSLKHWIPLVGLALLAGCGGSSDSSGSGSLGTQQYPQGIWQGTAGLGAAQRTVFAYIDGGADAKGGSFYMAKGATGTAGYDGMFGVLRVNVATVQASGVTYFSVQDGKFATGLTLSGTASNSGAIGRTDTIAANYSDPTGTAAASGAPVPLSLTYSTLNNYPAQAGLVQGTYQGGSTFGGNWVLNVDALGSVTGTVSGCTVTGTIVPKTNVSTATSISNAYTTTLNLTGSTVVCANPGTTQSGVAVLQYNSLNQPSGIWILTQNNTGTLNTMVLNGTLISGGSTPSTTQQSPTGFWKSASTTGSTSLSGVVLPDTSYFFYKQVGAGFDALYGTMQVTTGTSVVSSTDEVYFSNQSAAATQYTSALTLSGNAVTNVSLKGSYTDPTAANAQTAYNLVPDTSNLYLSPITPAVTSLYGSYNMPAIGFGGASTTLTIAASATVAGQSVISGTATNGCVINGNISAYGTNTTLNVYTVSGIAYTSATGSTCPLAGQPYQSGIASAVFDAAGQNVTGLRILAAGAVPAGSRSNLVFIGNKQ